MASHNIDNNVKTGSDQELGPGALFELYSDIKLVLGLTLLSLIFVFVPPLNATPVRAVLAFVMVLFLPGYSAVSALFPSGGEMAWLERLGMSLVFSIVVVPMICLAFHFASVGVFLEPMAVAIAVFTVGCAMIANVRRHSIGDVPAGFDAGRALGNIMDVLFPAPEGRTSVTMNVLMAVSLVALVLVISIAIVLPGPGEKFTEFYLIGPNGTATDYPQNFMYGNSSVINVGIANHEGKDMDYGLTILMHDANGAPYDMHSERIGVKAGEQVEKSISISPMVTGDRLKMDFFLYRPEDNGSPYRQCRLFVNVTGSPQSQSLHP